MKKIDICLMQRRSMRRDFLVRGSRRAIHVVLLNGPKALNEYETNSLVKHATTTAVQRCWKHILINVSSWGEVTYRNPSGADLPPQHIGKICELNHELNDKD